MFKLIEHPGGWFVECVPHVRSPAANKSNQRQTQEFQVP